MRIGITLNEVLRDFIGQLHYTYKKYVADPQIKETDVTNFNLIEFFKFDSVAKMNSFIYLEAPLEIFGHADQTHDGVITQLNQFIDEMEYEGEHQISIVSREVDKAIPATFFFLSKTGARISDLKFVKSYADKWNDVDVLITANPFALEAKPDNKISVKIKTPYNTEAKADYELDSIVDFFNDATLRNKILTKITTTDYEEIKKTTI